VAVTLVDTGPGHHDRRPPEARAPLPHPDEPFCFTYGDGVADLDIGALVAFHRQHGSDATVTAVEPPGRFGALELDGDGERFREKPPATAPGSTAASSCCIPT
jgi:glucose-1-phosphate cytidylyltransferase